MYPGLNTYDAVEWGQPINWSHPLNRGLAAWFLAVPLRFRVGSLQWQDLTRTHTGTLTSSPVWGRSPERPGGRLSLNSVSSTSYVQVPHATRLNLSETASTVAFWVRSAHAAADFSAFLDKGTGDSLAQHTWAIRASIASSDGRVSMLLEDNSATSTGAVFANNQWTHVVVTWDGTNVRFYSNGRYVESVAQPVGTYQSGRTDTLNINALRSSSGVISRSGVRLDDIRLYDSRVLGDGQVAELYRLSCQSQGALLNRFVLPRYSEQGGAVATPRPYIIGGGIGQFLGA